VPWASFGSAPASTMTTCVWSAVSCHTPNRGNSRPPGPISAAPSAFQALPPASVVTVMATCQGVAALGGWWYRP